jgi:hypothetical protein
VSRALKVVLCAVSGEFVRALDVASLGDVVVVPVQPLSASTEEVSLVRRGRPYARTNPVCLQTQVERSLRSKSMGSASEAEDVELASVTASVTASLEVKVGVDWSSLTSTLAAKLTATTSSSVTSS